MKDFNYPILDHLKKGLATKFNHRNTPFLVESYGAFPYENKFRALEVFSIINQTGRYEYYFPPDFAPSNPFGTIEQYAFPYPQIFVFSDCIIVCGPTEIYEYIKSNDYYIPNIFSLKLYDIPEYSTWEAVDFKTYIYLTNGKMVVTKSATTGEYSLKFGRDSLPAALSVCNYQGQVLLGSPVNYSFNTTPTITAINIVLSLVATSTSSSFPLTGYTTLGVDPGSLLLAAIRRNNVGILFLNQNNITF